MAQVFHSRPIRRAATRKTQVVDSDDDEDQQENESGMDDRNGPDSTPVLSRKSKRAPRKAIESTQSTPLRTPFSGDGDAEYNNNSVFSPPLSVASYSRLGTGRNTVWPGRVSLQPTAAKETITIPTPNPSTSLEGHISSKGATALADITEDVLNKAVEETNEPKSQFQLKSQPLQDRAEKPMDIVLRTRAKPAPPTQESTEPKPRMVLTYLILSNFKSYAGRQEVGPFHASFSSVVGPNGSGKSNVIDSLLFVFGFRASKMRQGKISSLIHNSAAFPDLPFCEVEVHFQQVIDRPLGAKELVPDSSLVISRRAFKNNASKYYINGSESSFTTVGSLLRDHGVDLDHKRFLILQGEVESIAQMKPKAANEHDDGLLEYLEDIIGTSKYKAPIEEAATETITLNEVCQEKNNRVQHVEKERKGLESKKNATLAYIKDENELAVKQSALWQIFVYECEDNTQVAEEAVTQLQSQLDGEVDRHNDSEEDIRRLEKKHATEAKTFERMEQATQAVLKQLAKQDKESVKFEEKRRHLTAKVKKLEKTSSLNHSAFSEAIACLRRLSEDCERNCASLSSIEEELRIEQEALTSIRESLRGKTQGISDQISSKQKFLEPWIEQISEKRSAIAVAQSEAQMLRDRDDAGAQALTEIQDKVKKYQDEKSEKEEDVQSFQSQKLSLEGQVRELESALRNLSQKEPEVRSKLSSARQKADEARASLSSSQAQGHVLTGLNRLKESGRMKGFHGRLGNLGTIDQKYDVAISTACPALENIVVDSVDVGEQCIDFLRKNSLGRANFILLDRLTQRDLSPVQTPENVPRLFDLLKSKEKRFLPAFYSALQNTLVAKDLEQASRVAYGAKRWRVVTLDGQLIDKSGTMSGGGTRAAKGAMSSKIVADTSKEQVAKLEAEKDAEQNKFSDLQDEQQSLSSSLKEADGSVPLVETQIQRCRLELESIDRKVADAHRRHDELSSTKQPSGSEKPRIKSLEDKIASLGNEIEDIQENTRDLEGNIKELQEQIMEIGGVKLRGQKAKVDGLKEQISTRNEEISSAEVAVAKTEKTKQKHSKAKEEAILDSRLVQAELEHLEEDAKSQSEDISGSKQKAEEAQEVKRDFCTNLRHRLTSIQALEAKKEELLTLKRELEQRTAELNKARGAEIERRNNLEENQKILNENVKRLRYWQEKLGKLTIQNIR